jgi:hypothetical protein
MVLQLKSTPTLTPPKTIKNDSERIATHLQLTEWLYYAIFPREAWIFLPDLWCSTLGTAESFTITQLSRSLQGYSVDTIGSTAEPKALQSQCILKLPIGLTYLNHKPGGRRLVT